MRGFLLDENLPGTVRFAPSFPIRHVRELGNSVTDASIWNFARDNDLVIVTKDTDFSNRILLTDPPPRVVHLRFGNLPLDAFHEHLESVWPRVEGLLLSHKPVDVYRDRIEAVA